MTEHSHPAALINAALAKARGDFPDIPRNRTATIRMKSGGSYSYKYADLADVFKAITPAMSEHGLAVMQYPEDDMLVTVILHESGAEKEALFPIKPMPQRSLDDAPSFQSAVQVAKRYALTALLGITTEETVEGSDADGQNKDTRSWAKTITDELPENATDRQKANAVAAALIAQWKRKPTVTQLSNEWDRRAGVIAALAEKFADLHADVLEAYVKRENEIEGVEDEDDEVA